MDWIFLSPHFDDAAFSCGGMIWERVNEGDTVQVWTICAGEIPEGKLSPFAEELHLRWEAGEDVIEARRKEDEESCKRLGALPYRFPIPDCIYRRAGDDYWNPKGDSFRTGSAAHEYLYPSEDDLFKDVHPAESVLIDNLSKKFITQLPIGARLVCPLAIGGHVDHVLVRSAAEKTGRALWYYADVPYVMSDLSSITALTGEKWIQAFFPISQAGLDAWVAGISAHASQISTFWQEMSAIRASINELIDGLGGFSLWMPK